MVVALKYMHTKIACLLLRSESGTAPLCSILLDLHCSNTNLPLAVETEKFVITLYLTVRIKVISEIYGAIKKNYNYLCAIHPLPCHWQGNLTTNTRIKKMCHVARGRV